MGRNEADQLDTYLGVLRAVGGAYLVLRAVGGAYLGVLRAVGGAPPSFSEYNTDFSLS